MSGQTKGRRAASNVLIAIGAIILLSVAGYFLWGQYRGAQLRASLRATPTPFLTPSVGATSTARPSLIDPTPTLAPSPTAPPPSTTATAVRLVARATPEPTRAQAEPTSTVTPAVTAPVIPAPVSAGPPVRLAIPDLGIDVPVVEMAWEAVQTATGLQTAWVIPENEAGHHIDSAQLNQPGNLVISGHNNIYGRVFERISLAWPGNSTKVDEVTERSDILNGRTIQLYDQAGELFEYTITDFLRLKDTGIPLAQRVENAQYMRSTDDARLTLVTCWPPWSNTHRLIVIAKPAVQ